MKRIKIMGLALVAIMAMGVMAATASAKTEIVLRDSTGVLAAGTHIDAISHNLTTVTSAGTLECETDELEGSVTNNSGSVDKGVVGESEPGGFGSRNFGSYLGIPGACKTSAAGPAIITTSSYPWTIEFKYSATKGGEVFNKSSGGTKKVTFTSEFLALEGPNNKCTFEDAKIVSKYTIGAKGSPTPVLFTTPNSTFKLNKKAPDTAPICPKEGKLSGNWELVDSNGAVSAEL